MFKIFYGINIEIPRSKRINSLKEVDNL
ncbi:Hypothetical protein KK9_0001 [Borreliella garinii BgVir]|uniref:Uncharacterized protein n=1 Tax=Borrelia garinii subsp. bavariensis (strain ATCC BAA-2496 / DSM 23469 / PBi) TaxID=290434 RepID=A0A7I6GVA7_BORGP|nr:hypothetical protein BG0001 [Borreliella bavariensis PBi]AEW68343.1 Hypothetical protein KK9_0001 [Borreliella garinii BgVir]